MSNDSWGSNEDVSLAPPDGWRKKGAESPRRGPVVETTEVKALVGLLEQFAIDEKERLRNIARRVSVV